MKASKELLTKSYGVPNSHFFATREERNAYFTTNNYTNGTLCAISSTGSKNVEDSESIWELEIFNGVNWAMKSVDTDYSLVITNEGVMALSYVGETSSGYRVNISAVKIKSNNISSDELAKRPLVQWTNDDFVAGNDIILNTRDKEVNPTFTLDKNLSGRLNMANGGIQYSVLIDNSTVGYVNGNKIYDYTIGAVGLYVPDPENTNRDILFAVANMNNSIAKYSTTVQRVGNSIKLYLNTVLSNLGQATDMTLFPEDVGSIPEVGSSAELEGLYQDPINAPYNLYLVNSLHDSNVPALAVRTGSKEESTLGWTYMSPSDDVIHMEPSQVDSSLKDYMVATWDSKTERFIKADGNLSNSDSQIIGIKVGNNLLFAGKIVQKPNVYAYKHTMIGGGSNYAPGEVLTYVATGTSGKKINFTIRINDVDANGKVAANGFYITPTLGEAALVSEVVDSSKITYLSDKKKGNGTGFSLRRTVEDKSKAIYEWNFTNNEIDKPLYVGTGNNAGKLTTTETGIFVGWCTSANSIKMAVDLRNQASQSDTGTVRIATNSEVSNVKSNSGVATKVVICPKTLQDNYVQKTKVSGNPGDTKNNPINIATHVKFSETIVGKGVPDMPTTTTYDANVSFFGLAYRAWWGDLAEFYTADDIYDAGTLITIGDGNAEITLAKTECNGIISTAPGYELGEKKSAFDLPVALVGKVPVLMSKDCTPRFGDRIYLSKTEPGHASTIPNGRCLGKIIDKNNDLKNKKTVMCSVKISF